MKIRKITQKFFPRYAMLLSLTIILSVLIFGVNAFAETEDSTQSYETTDPFLYTVGEPVIRERSDTEKQFFFYRDDIRIWGKLYLPEGEGPFPAVIMSSGYRARGTFNDKWAKQFAANGFAAVIFDFAGSSAGTQSGGNLTDLSVFSEAADLNVVIDSLVAMPVIDKENIFLFGHSFGGLVSAYIGCSRPNDIQGMLLVEPSFQLKDAVMADYPDLDQIPDVMYTPDFLGKIYFIDLYSFDIFDLMPSFQKDVLIFSATAPSSIGGSCPEYFSRAVETFPSAELVRVEGADHPFQGEAGDTMMENAIAFLNCHIHQP